MPDRQFITGGDDCDQREQKRPRWDPSPPGAERCCLCRPGHCPRWGETGIWVQPEDSGWCLFSACYGLVLSPAPALAGWETGSVLVGRGPPMVTRGQTLPAFPSTVLWPKPFVLSKDRPHKNHQGLGKIQILGPRLKVLTQKLCSKVRESGSDTWLVCRCLCDSLPCSEPAVQGGNTQGGTR